MDNLRQAIGLANQQAIALHQQGRKSEAADAAKWAYTQAREHLPPDDDLQRRTAMNAAALAELAGDGETAIILYTDAMGVADALGDVATLGQAFVGSAASQDPRPSPCGGGGGAQAGRDPASHVARQHELPCRTQRGDRMS